MDCRTRLILCCGGVLKHRLLLSYHPLQQSRVLGLHLHLQVIVPVEIRPVVLRESCSPSKCVYLKVCWQCVLVGEGVCVCTSCHSRGMQEQEGVGEVGDSLLGSHLAWLKKMDCLFLYLQLPRPIVRFLCEAVRSESTPVEKLNFLRNSPTRIYLGTVFITNNQKWS